MAYDINQLILTIEPCQSIYYDSLCSLCIVYYIVCLYPSYLCSISDKNIYSRCNRVATPQIYR